LDICTSFEAGIDDLADFFHVKIKFYQGWWMTKKMQKIVFEAQNCSK
jgi:hypothetical protein